MKMKMKMNIVLASLLAGAALSGGVVQAADDCGGATSGGEWRGYGADLSNTRSQPAETTIGTTKAAALAPKWSVAIDAAGMAGNFQVTPAVADGCVYVGTTDGWVAAFHADTGALDWKVRLDIETGGFGGRIVGSPAVENGHVYIHANEYGNPITGKGPSLVSLDQDTGALEWRTTLDSLENAYVNSSPVLFNGMVFSGIAGPESSPRARGGYAILDAETGEILVKRYTINDDDYAKGHAGASIWSTAAIDTTTGYAYAGGGNPASKKVEHPFSNALLKIDVNPARASFGKIVAAFKGNHDAYSQTVANQPACDLLGDHPSLQYSDIWSAPCGQLDLDFGASPNLFRTAEGKLMVGALQKSGVYHAANTDLMTYGFSLPVGAPCFACNAASASTAGDKIFVASVPPGQLTSIDGSEALYRWAAPLGDGLHFQPVSNANGVVYVMDGHGYLNAMDAATGVPLLRRNMSPDAGGATSRALTSSAGVAIARNTGYAASGKVLVAYA